MLDLQDAALLNSGIVLISFSFSTDQFPNIPARQMENFPSLFRNSVKQQN